MDGRRRQNRRGKGRPSGPVVVQTPALAGCIAAESQMNAGCSRKGSGLCFVFVFFFFSIRTKTKSFWS